MGSNKANLYQSIAKNGSLPEGELGSLNVDDSAVTDEDCACRNDNVLANHIIFNKKWCLFSDAFPSPASFSAFGWKKRKKKEKKKLT